tara:strand:+ start:193 stop:501 length:309 start_codon:yes stop_codon:yes gene_type:complete
MFKHLSVFVAALVMGSGFTLAAQQHQSGEAAYLQRCAPCHINTVSGEGGGDERAPTLEAIGFMSRERVRTALTSGSMRTHTEGLEPQTFKELMLFLVPDDSP